jgi:hypothetical protein
MGGNQAEARLKDSRDKWKSKSRQKSAVNKRYQRRIKELEHSRDLWKGKYLGQKGNAIISASPYEPVARHTYDSGIIWLSVWMQSVGKCSFRSCRHLVVASGLYLRTYLRVPSASSTRLWFCKCGHYHYHRGKDGQANWAVRS